MKAIVAGVVGFLIMSFPMAGSAIEYVWTDEQGNRVFDCGGFVVGGRAVVKDLGRGEYRVKGVLIDRTVKTTSIYAAAQIACGERAEVTETQPEEKAE